MKFNLLTDACCDLPYSYLKEQGVSYVSMHVTVDQQEYADDLGETLDTDWLMGELKAGKMPTTSQINVAAYLALFEPLIASEIPSLYIAFSSGLSGSYNNAVTALKMLEEEHGELPITVFDSKAACLGEGLLVYEAIQLREQDYSLEEAIQVLEEKAVRLHSWVTVADLNHLERGGRISKTSAAVGSLMNIKPIIIVNAEGKLINVSKSRGRKKSLERLANETSKGMVDSAQQTVFIAYAGDLEAAEFVKEQIEKQVPTKEIKIMPMGPTIASHTGYAAIAVFSFGEIRK